MDSIPGTFPLVDGLTQSVTDTESFVTRLADFFETQQGNSQQDLTDGIRSLERAFAKETNEDIKARLAMAIMFARDGPPV